MAEGEIELLAPLLNLSSQMENNLNSFLDQVAANAPPELRDVLFEAKQSTMGKAIAADVIDVIPVLGDVSNFFRVRHAGKLGIDRPRRVSRQTLDLALGALPEPVGAILDVLTPTGTITYLEDNGFLPKRR